MMTKKSIDLIYAKKGLSFFNRLGTMKQITDEYKQKNSISAFDQKDEFEIARGKTYALFPELVQLVDAKEKVTTAAFRGSLSRRGITDTAFQNKILNLLLQNRAGIAYGVGEIVTSELQMQYLMDQDQREFQIEIDENGHVNLTFKAIWKFPSSERWEEPVFGVKATFNISPEMVTITSCEFSQLSDHPGDVEVFETLENQQQNILEQLITFIQRYFGYNSELRLEEKSDQDQRWAP